MEPKSQISNDELARRTLHQEHVNAITHGCGLVLSLVAAALLMRVVAVRGDVWLLLGSAIYSFTLVAVYAASTLSHCIQRPEPKHFFRTWDQGLIFLLIAGTFTPFAMAYLRSGWWWVLVVATWVLALAGFISKVVRRHRVEAVSILPYLVVGWLPILGLGPVIAQAPAGALYWAGVGEACYILGIVFLVLDHKAIYLHAVWHLLVIAGSGFQFLCIYRCMVA
ncbi:MAG: hemolysin III family protein [Planctomycetes bacterium]|nr:hemolysin III family protein [Planctomycetota bacterium]